MNPPWPRRGLYAITPDDADTRRLLARVETVLQAGAAWLQYRNKLASDDLRAEQALALQPLCRTYNVPLIINDDWALAAAEAKRAMNRSISSRRRMRVEASPWRGVKLNPFQHLAGTPAPGPGRC